MDRLLLVTAQQPRTLMLWLSAAINVVRKVLTGPRILSDSEAMASHGHTVRVDGKRVHLGHQIRSVAASILIPSRQTFPVIRHRNRRIRYLRILHARTGLNREAAAAACFKCCILHGRIPM